ncbi:MAG: hypothetical protein KGD64_10560 [Candidatus Heimdallarchaeota archaeon]|nr:hypothetical protein [Candidatus Heimdallarchaeota archaeon]
MKIEPELKYMKPAKLAFFVGNYDVFHLKIDVDLLGGKNPKEVLDIFIKNIGKSLFTSKRENRLKIEYARSGRAKCKKCNETIEKEFIRLGAPFYYQDHLSFRWFHENCIDLTKYDKDMLAGLEVLSENDRKRIEKKLKK